MIEKTSPVVYARRYPKKWRQLAIQSGALAVVLSPLLFVRLSSTRLVIAIALGGLALTALSLCVHGLKFLRTQERRHAEATPEMSFVFMVVAVYPLALSVFLLILLAEM